MFVHTFGYRYNLALTSIAWRNLVTVVANVEWDHCYILGWTSKGPKIQRRVRKKSHQRAEGWGVEGEWEGLPCGQGLWSHTCRRSPVWSFARSPSRLTAQMIDDTSRALRLYTPKQTTCQRECQSPGLREKERENVQNVQWQETRKESVTSDYDLVTVTAYSNFWMSKSGTFQPDTLSSIASHNIPLTVVLKNFFMETFQEANLPHVVAVVTDKWITTSARVRSVKFIHFQLLPSEWWQNATTSVD